MRFIHTADWHLGRLFHGVHLTDDQAHVLRQLVDLVRDAKPDAIIIAGDVYDRAVPPPEAVELLDEILSRLIIDLKVPVLVIAGNHDSPGRLNFGSRLLAERRLFVTGTLPRTCSAIVLNDARGPVHFYPLPYTEPSIVRQCLECPTIIDHNAAMAALVERVRAVHPIGGRSVVIGHAFVAGGNECESERPLSVGGAGTVDGGCFAGFHYVALGHLHRPQTIGCDTVRYSGSILKYSFDEADGQKGVHLVEMDGDGTCTCETICLVPRRDVRRVSGLMADLMNGPADDASKEDYLEVTLLDEGPVLDAIGRLRERYPNVLSIKRPDAADAAAAGDRPDVRTMKDVELFRAFYAHVTGAELTEGQESAFVSIVDDMNAEQREGASAAVGAAAAPIAATGGAAPEPVAT